MPADAVGEAHHILVTGRAPVPDGSDAVQRPIYARPVIKLQVMASDTLCTTNGRSWQYYSTLQPA